MNINRVVITGRFGQDPEIRYTQSGKAVCSFDLAVAGRKTQDGQDTHWIPVVCWERTAELVGEYCRKGSIVALDGRLQARTYETRDGAQRKVIEVDADQVQFLSRPEGQAVAGGQTQGNRAPAPRQGRQQQSGRQAAQQTFGGGYDQGLEMDDVPF